MGEAQPAFVVVPAIPSSSRRHDGTIRPSGVQCLNAPLVAVPSGINMLAAPCDRLRTGSSGGSLFCRRLRFESVREFTTRPTSAPTPALVVASQTDRQPRTPAPTPATTRANIDTTVADILALGKQRSFSKAWRLFRRTVDTLSQDVEPPPLSLFVAIVKVLERQSRMVQPVGRVVRYSPERHKGSRASPEDAVVIVDRIREALDLLEAARLPPTTDLFTFKILGNGLGRRLKVAQDMLAAMETAGLTPSIAAYEAVVKAAGICGRPEVATDYVDAAMRAGLPPSDRLLNTIAEAYLLQSRVDEAGEWIDRMRGYGIRPQLRTYDDFCRCCIRLEHFDRALEALKEFKDDRYSDEECNQLAASVAKSFGACDDVRRARKVLAVLDDLGVRPDCRVYEAVVEAATLAGADEVANTILERLCQDRTQTDETVNRVAVVFIVGLLNIKEYGTVFEVPRTLLRMGRKPSDEAFTWILLTLQNHGGTERDRDAVLTAMHKLGLHPVPAILSADHAMPEE